MTTKQVRVYKETDALVDKIIANKKQNNGANFSRAMIYKKAILSMLSNGVDHTLIDIIESKFKLFRSELEILCDAYDIPDKRVNTIIDIIARTEAQCKQVFHGGMED